MSTTLALTAPGWSAALAPQNTDEAWKVATALAKSKLVPKAYEGQPGEILIAAAMGSRLGLDVFSALQSIAVVNGKPTLYGDALLAVCQSRADWRGMDVKWEGKGEDESVTVTVRRNNKAGEQVETTDGRFGVADAKRAGLWSKQGPWSQFPRRMMEMRARAYALRGAFADALLGFHSREEVEDTPPMKEADASVREDAPAKGRRIKVVDPLGLSAAEQAKVEAESEIERAKDAPAGESKQEATGTDKPVTEADASVDATAKDAGTEQASAAPVPTADQVREAVNRAASALGAGGSTRVVKAVQDALGYPIGKAADIREADRAKAIAIADGLAGIGG